MYSIYRRAELMLALFNYLNRKPRSAKFQEKEPRSYLLVTSDESGGRLYFIVITLLICNSNYYLKVPFLLI